MELLKSGAKPLQFPLMILNIANVSLEFDNDMHDATRQLKSFISTDLLYSVLKWKQSALKPRN